MEGHFCYPEKLIEDCIAYYREFDGRILTPEEAAEHLDSLAELWDLLTDTLKNGFLPSKQSAKGRRSRVTVSGVESAPSEAGGGAGAKRRAPEPSSSSET